MRRISGHTGLKSWRGQHGLVVHAPGAFGSARRANSMILPRQLV